MDRYELNNASIPEMNSADQFFDYVRGNLIELVGDGDIINEFVGVTLDAYSNTDLATWESDNPYGAIMSFSSLFDDMSVMVTDYNESDNSWIFSTVYTQKDFGHPVSGHRQFGVEDNGDGSFNFYSEGIDRTTNLLDNILSDIVFSEGDQVWKKLFYNLKKDIEEKLGGSTQEFDRNGVYGDQYEYKENIDCE